MPGQMESAFLERFEHKKDDVKHRLNDIVDDLFAYLAVELTRLAQPPDRQPAPILVAVVPNNTNNVQQPKKVPPVLEIKEEVVDDDEPIVDNHNQISQTRSAEISSSSNSVANNVVPSTSCIATTSSCNLTVSIPSTSSGAGSSTNVISSSHHQPPIISIHSGLPNDEIELDEEYLDEHSDSDCDCEQCMGVPICKVDIDDIDPHDRPAKKQKTNCNSANNSSNNQHHDSIADYHDGDDGEQCSATFKTISIKCSQDDCPSMFKNKIERNQHLLYVHGILPYTCLMNGCSKGFDNVSV